MIPRITGDDTTETRTRLPPSQDATEGAATPADAGVPSSIDRFRVIRQIGVGGMGTVFEAFDPELDRKIAVKLLAGEHGPEETESKRLLREARSLAQISHPNVVEIYGAGIDDGRVWLAMELVEGRTLKQWAAENPPGTDAQRDAAVDLLRQAAAGLSAAHARGMTHRDFKPANALVGSDGRVRVVDFGLAVRQLAPGEKDLAKSLPDESSSALRTYDDAITRTGAVLGTPRYMAPEQHRGEPATPRTDQFAFAVTAWELLYGEPPFELVSVAAIYDAIVSRSFREPASQSVPRWMNRVLRKALSPVPARRYRTMDALVRALEGRTRRRRIAGVAFAVGLSSVGVFVARPTRAPVRSAEQAESCEAIAQKRFDAVWTADTRTRIQAAVQATDVPFAVDTETTLRLAVDRYRDEWLDAATRVCAATEGKLAEGSCIDEDLRVFAGVLADAQDMTPKKAERLGSAFDALPSPARCVADSNDERTRPVDPALTRRLSDAKVAFAVGDLERAERLTREVLEAAVPWSIRADALILRGRVIMEEDPRAGYEAWERAYDLAVEHDASVLAADAAWHLAVRRAGAGDRKSAEDWEQRRNAEVSRVEDWSGPSEDHLRCLVLENLNEYAQARPWCERVFAALPADTASPQRKEVANALTNIYRRTGQLELALQIALELYEAALRQLGSSHPSTGGALMNLGNAYSAVGRHGESADCAARARVVFAHAYGENNRWAIGAAMNEALQYQRQGDLKQADTRLSELLPALDDERIDAAQAARVLTNLAGLRIDQGQHQQALELLARVRGLQSSALRPDDREVAYTFACEMWAHCGLHQWDDALAAANEAIRIREKKAETPELLPVLRGRALILRRLGRLDEARADVAAGLEHRQSPPEMGLLHLSGALVEFDAGNLDAAARHMDLAATEVDPEAAPEGQAGLRFLQARLAYERGDDQPTALEAAKATLADLETSPLLFFPLEEARAWVEEATVKSR